MADNKQHNSGHAGYRGHHRHVALAALDGQLNGPKCALWCRAKGCAKAYVNFFTNGRTAAGIATKQILRFTSARIAKMPDHHSYPLTACHEENHSFDIRNDATRQVAVLYCSVLLCTLGTLIVQWCNPSDRF
jgi:hypothetical protein